MKYLIVVFFGFCISSLLYAQDNNDSLIINSLISLNKDSLKAYSKKNITNEKDIKPLLDLFLKLKLNEGKSQIPSLDFYNQLQLRNEYNFSNSFPPKEEPLTFANYNMKRIERLEALRKLTEEQREALLKVLRDSVTKDSPEMAYIRKVLGAAQGTTALIFLIMSLL